MIKLNGVELKFTTFPNGETCVDGKRIMSLVQDSNYVTFKYESDSDLIKLMFVKKYLDEFEADKIDIEILYMPYSRMDRVEEDSVFTLKYVSEFVNSLNFNQVTVYEPHSDVTPALLNRCTAYFPTKDILGLVMNEIGFDPKNDYVYYPDGGAEKRYGKLGDFNKLVGMKHRDFKTGNITSLEVIGKVSDMGFKVIMIDDLCSKGGTFMLGAEKLIEMGASEIYLVVGHCENTIFNGGILSSNFIDKVYTTNSILTLTTNNKIHVIDIQ